MMLSKIFNALKERLTKRSFRFLYQRLTRGWDDSETWSLDMRLARHILPRLRRFKEITYTRPPYLSSEEWEVALGKMISAMEFMAQDPSVRKETEETWEKVQEGLELFGKHYRCLWW